jgi:hypothetical protein
MTEQTRDRGVIPAPHVVRPTHITLKTPHTIELHMTRSSHQVSIGFGLSLSGVVKPGKSRSSRFRGCKRLSREHCLEYEGWRQVKWILKTTP